MVLTNSSIGSYGWLGNQLFQYAVLVGLREARGVEIGIPSGDYELTRVFDIPTHPVASFPSLRYTESGFGYDAAVMDTPDGTDIRGYFQSERYFSHCKPALRRAVCFRLAIVEEASRLFDNPSGLPTVAVHVRRGNYALYPGVHPILGHDYYDRALALIPDDCRVMVFSDDIEWCKRHFDRCVFSVGRSTGVDLALMALCDHFVIANSSYSWWGAWLGEKDGSVVVAPERWFGPDGPTDTQDLIPARWTRT
jgi:hypothetical protein